MTEPSLVDMFTDSWRAADGGDLASRAARQSLEALAYNNTQLSTALAWVKMSGQAELDFHLAGAGVRGHETDALPFGRLVQRTAETEREMARTITGNFRTAATLQVVAPAMGSVRVVFKSPDVADPGLGARSPEFTPTTADTAALERLVDVLVVASGDDAADSGTLAAVHGLSAASRAAIVRMAKTVKSAGWDIEGELRHRGHRPVLVRVTPVSADRIVRAVDAKTVSITTMTATGIVDGNRPSMPVMWFIPDTGRFFGASVSTPELLAEVARIGASGDVRVQATFTVRTFHATTDSEPTRREHVLQSLVVVEQNQAEAVPMFD